MLNYRQRNRKEESLIAREEALYRRQASLKKIEDTSGGIRSEINEFLMRELHRKEATKSLGRRGKQETIRT